MDPFVRHCLLNGLDAIERTLQHESDIAAFEGRAASPVETTAL
jgi:3-isopropylmalate/(R)-2-methylmalate dehydratase small subunit